MNKPKILLVIDKPNWVYDQMANFIIKELSNKYDFYKMVAHYNLKPEKQSLNYKIKDIPRYLKRWKYEKYSKSINYDIIVYLWWFIPELINNTLKFKKEIRGIFTESFPPGKTIDFDGSIQEFINKYIKPSSGIIAGNRNIENFYGQFNLPVYYATGSTDTNLFKYNKKKRDDNELRVCWTGNPHRNFKGFFDFVEPAVKLAQKQRPNIKLVTRFSGPLETLPEFYSNVDVMVNASIGDAGPGFIIDAGGCGIPTISTDVGFASEIIKDKENGMIVERNIEQIVEKIVEIYDNKELLEKMSKNISQDIQKEWGHTSRAKYWDDMFRKVLENE